MNNNHLPGILQGTFIDGVYDFAFLKYFDHIVWQAQVQKILKSG